MLQYEYCKQHFQKNIAIPTKYDDKGQSRRHVYSNGEQGDAPILVWL